MTLELDKLKDLPKDQTIVTELMQALYAKKPITGPDGVLTKLLKQTFEVALEGEIDAHFLANKAQEQGNRRNGKCSQNIPIVSSLKSTLALCALHVNSF